MKALGKTALWVLVAAPMFSAGHDDAVSFIGPLNKIKVVASTVPSMM